MFTIRTLLPYFSPNKAIAPNFFASSNVVSIVTTSKAAQIFSFTIRSISANSSAVTCPKWLKSKRKYPGATNEPAWFACVPNTSFNAWCNK